jgi:hypothetical protein
MSQGLNWNPGEDFVAIDFEWKLEMLGWMVKITLKEI